MLQAVSAVEDSQSHMVGFKCSGPTDGEVPTYTAKELLPVVIAAALWGKQWIGQRVCFNCDNMAVVDLLRSRTTKDTLIMHLLRCLSFYAAFYQFNFESRHVSGSQNTCYFS